MQTKIDWVEMECDCRRNPSRLVFLSSVILAILLVSSAFSQNDQSRLTPEIETRLRDQLAGGSSESKRSALAEIRNLRSAEASRLAVPSLRDSDPVVRATAAASVIFLPTNEASSALTPLLSDKDEFVRREAAYALGDVRDPSSATPLLRLLQSDKILEVRSASVIAIGKIGNESAVGGLVAILRSRPREDDEFLRRSAARSIGQIAQIVATGNPTVLTPQNFLPEKFKDVDPGSDQANRFASAIDVLTSVLRSSNESDDTRREAAFALGAIGDSRSISVLQKYTAGPDPYLAEICKEALLKIERRNKPTGPTE